MSINRRAVLATRAEVGALAAPGVSAATRQEELVNIYVMALRTLGEGPIEAWTPDTVTKAVERCLSLGFTI